MEVHHHAHLAPGETHSSRTKWTHYFWEFLMLFLAVFCGFLAEYQLEHKIEKDKEKQLIQTMIFDLQEDTTSLNRVHFVNQKKGIELDSLITLLSATNIKELGVPLYYYGRRANRWTFFTSTDRTIQQMKNSGGFRLIRNTEAATQIIKYYSELDNLYLLQSNANMQQIEYRNLAFALFDPMILETMVNDSTDNEIIKPTGNPSLLTYNRAPVLKVLSILHYMQGSRRVFSQIYSALKQRAAELIEFLKKDYQLK